MRFGLTLWLFLELIILPLSVYAEAEADRWYYQFYDSNGRLLLESGIVPKIGDQYIHENNMLYEVTSIQGKQVQFTFIKQVALAEIAIKPAQAQQTPSRLAIYHSHTDESYIPEDGKAALPGQGSIMRVGETFAANLRQAGYEVTHDLTLHDPHDANAYQRSRRTVFELLKQQPTALFDLHRDSAPINNYLTEINGQTSARILLVVGRSNPQQAISLEYAKTIKSAADSQHEGLIRGIFIAHGNYNQDLSPRDILVEVGTQYNTLEQADRAIALFSDAVPLFIAKTTTQGASTSGLPLFTPQPAVYTYNILSILGILALGIALYTALSFGSIAELRAKWARFKSREFLNWFGPLRKKRRKGNRP